MNLFDDKRYEVFINGEEFRGLWGVSSDGLSYYIRMSDDFVELHEVLYLSQDILVELPVAQMRKDEVQVKQILFKKEE